MNNLFYMAFLSKMYFNPFQSNVTFLYSPKTSDKRQMFSTSSASIMLKGFSWPFIKKLCKTMIAFVISFAVSTSSQQLYKMQKLERQLSRKLFQLQAWLMTFYNSQVTRGQKGNVLSIALSNLYLKKKLHPQQIPMDILYLNILNVWDLGHPAIHYQ